MLPKDCKCQATGFNIVSIDIETLSIEPDAVILSIGACIVGTDKTFYSTCNVHELIVQGRTASRDTLAFWSEHILSFVNLLEACSRNAPHTLPHVLKQLAVFINDNCPGDHLVYSKGRVDFDVLEHAYKSLSLKEPWFHSNIRCLRTLIEDAKIDEENLPFINPSKHDALSDALYQAEIIELAREELGL